jgi:hypothetical protein
MIIPASAATFVAYATTDDNSGGGGSSGPTTLNCDSSSNDPNCASEGGGGGQTPQADCKKKADNPSCSSTTTKTPPCDPDTDPKCPPSETKPPCPTGTHTAGDDICVGCPKASASGNIPVVDECPPRCPPQQGGKSSALCLPPPCPDGQIHKNGRFGPCVCPQGKDKVGDNCLPPCPPNTHREKNGACVRTIVKHETETITKTKIITIPAPEGEKQKFFTVTQMNDPANYKVGLIVDLDQTKATKSSGDWAVHLQGKLTDLTVPQVRNDRIMITLLLYNAENRVIAKDYASLINYNGDIRTGESTDWHTFIGGTSNADGLTKESLQSIDHVVYHVEIMTA